MLLKERMGQVSAQSKRARQDLDLCSKQSCWVNEAPPGSRQAARESASAARVSASVWSYSCGALVCLFGFSRSRLSDSAARLGSVAMAAARCHGPGPSDAVRSIFHIHVATIASRSSSPSGRTVGGPKHEVCKRSSSFSANTKIIQSSQVQEASLAKLPTTFDKTCSIARSQLEIGHNCKHSSGAIRARTPVRVRARLYECALNSPTACCTAIRPRRTWCQHPMFRCCKACFIWRSLCVLICHTHGDKRLSRMLIWGQASGREHLGKNVLSALGRASEFEVVINRQTALDAERWWPAL